MKPLRILICLVILSAISCEKNVDVIQHSIPNSEVNESVLNEYEFKSIQDLAKSELPMFIVDNLPVESNSIVIEDLSNNQKNIWFIEYSFDEKIVQTVIIEQRNKNNIPELSKITQISCKCDLQEIPITRIELYPKLTITCDNESDDCYMELLKLDI